MAFGVGPVFAKEIMDSGIDAQSMVVLTTGVASLGAGIVMLIRRDFIRITKTQIWQLVLFCGCGEGLTVLLLANSYNHLPIGLATLFHFIYPVIVAIIMMVLFTEKISALKIIAIVSAVAGLCLIIDISGRMSIMGVLLALGSGFTYAVYVVANRKGAYSGLPALIIVFFSTCVTCLGVALFQIVNGRIALPFSAREWFLVAGSGLFSHLFALFMLTCAIRRIGASNAAIGNMLEPLTALIAGSIVYGDKITSFAMCGCALLLIAITLIALNEKQLS